MGVTLDLETRGAVQPNTPSCGNQPAHIRVTTRRKTRGHRPPVRPEPRRRPRSHRGRRLTLPLDKPALHILSLIHISEPTRLGMISYAVFCLKKKKKNKIQK